MNRNQTHLPIVRRAFTLIELLTVMAITSIILALIVIPVIQSFNLFRQAQALADAQEKGRLLIERISHEISDAQSVRSASGTVASTLNGGNATVPRDSVTVQVPGKDKTWTDVSLPHAKIDVILPSQGDPSKKILGAYINPVTGYGDPTLASARGQISLPLTPGATWVRYTIGQRDPLQDYNNPYDGRLMARNGQRDNLFVLYRIQFQPYVLRANKATPNDATTMAWRPNLALFASDATDLQIINDGLDDPKFLLPNRSGTGQIINNDAKATTIAHWLGQNPDNIAQNLLPKATMQTDLSRYDMIQAVLDPSLRTPTPLYDGNVPRLFPLVSFQPTRVSNEPATGQVAVRQGEETDNAQTIGPDVYRTQNSLWDNAVIRTWPAGWLSTDNTRNQYYVGRSDPAAGNPGVAPGFSIYYYDPASSIDDYTTGTEVFDVFTYNATVNSNQRYPFSAAINAANARSSWLNNAAIRSTFVPYNYSSAGGKVLASFGIKEIGDPSVATPAWDPDNLPYIYSGNAFSPYNETTVGGNFYDPVYQDKVNTLFNKLWNDFPGLQGDFIERFVDLRMRSNLDGTPSPLVPFYVSGKASGLSKARIVPGSEEIYGPDSLPGPGYGQMIRYTRTTKRPVGPNQYLLNYVDQPEPDYTQLGIPSGLLAGFDPNNYDPKNFVSAVIQPRFKKGYLALNSDPNVPIPQGTFLFSYRFQFTGSNPGQSSLTAGNKSDVFAVDYDTRQLISVLLTIRNYPQSTLPNPQNVTLKATAAVRNYAR